jgi:hypothetical protein
MSEARLCSAPTRHCESNAVQLVQDTGPAARVDRAHPRRARSILMGKTDRTIDGEVIKEDGDG